jgi:tryptophan synthase alpha chain
MRNLEIVFRRARAERRVALVGYVPAGFPDVDTYLQVVKVAVEAGLDVLEIGLPVEEAVLDGQVIRSALASIVASGITVDRALELGAKSLRGLKAAGVAMIYASALADYGADRLLSRCRRLGISGVLLVGAPAEDWIMFGEAANRAGVRPIGFLTAQANGQSLQSIVAQTDGFLYVQSYKGETGQYYGFGDQIKTRLKHIQTYAHPKDLPVVVGFGVRRPQDVQRLMDMGADGVVIGTALVEAAARGPEAIHQLISGLAAASRAS